ncbi:MAG: hypothetical protein WB729_07195 [Candidatus Sulfotelmatobacter sp.]
MSTKSLLRLVLCIAFLNLFCLFSASQQTPPPSNPDSSAPATAKDQSQDAPKSQPSSQPSTQQQPGAAGDASAQDKSKGTSKDRLFFTLPNFSTLEGGGKVPPLTSKQKFKLVFRSSFDYVEYPWYGVLAGISQAENTEPGYGQGWEGYAKRYGSAFADGTIENVMVGAVFPSLFHQDPRFYQSSQGGFSRRTGYAISRIFVTRTDSGQSQFNYSEIFGSALSAAISTNTYHPRAFISTRFVPATDELIYIHNASDRTLSNTASVWGTQLIYDTITIEIKEFWPDIHRKLSHKHESDAAPQTAGR